MLAQGADPTLAFPTTVKVGAQIFARAMWDCRNLAPADLKFSTAYGGHGLDAACIVRDRTAAYEALGLTDRVREFCGRMLEFIDNEVSPQQHLIDGGEE